jgi:hypothetical protein
MSKRLLAVVALAAAVVGVSGCIVVPAYPGGYGGGYRHGHGFGQDGYGRGGPPQGGYAAPQPDYRDRGDRPPRGW